VRRNHAIMGMMLTLVFAALIVAIELRLFSTLMMLYHACACVYAVIRLDTSLVTVRYSF
jgi:hypothetical protein